VTPKRSWQLQEAKARLSQLVRSAQTDGPQAISVRGETAVIVLSKKDFLRLADRGSSFVQFMRRSPLGGIDLKVERDRSPVRDVSL